MKASNRKGVRHPASSESGQEEPRHTIRHIGRPHQAGTAGDRQRSSGRLDACRLRRDACVRKRSFRRRHRETKKTAAADSGRS